jgi:glycosyltransferase involved in cell wall biosynthesis
VRILHICYSDLNGGAARAAYRLHRSHKKYGLDSCMLVVEKTSNDPSVYAVSKFESLRIRLSNKISRLLLLLQQSENPIHHSLNVISSGLVKTVNNINPDIINLHWIGNEMISIKEISSLAQPIVWTLHDMWAFCGAEHYSDDSNTIDRFTNGYCKSGRNNRDRGLDINRFIHSRKMKYWKNSNMTIVCPSNWMSECANKSTLLDGKNILVINNCVDHQQYYPMNMDSSRSLLNLAPNKIFILFGAVSGRSDPRKGFFYLNSALNQIAKDSDVELIVFGDGTKGFTTNRAITIHSFGAVMDDDTLRTLYNAATVFVAPSLQDNLPNTVVEALACGTPCVVFPIGGMAELISDTELGWLCESVSVKSLTDGIRSQLSKTYSRFEVSNISKSLRGESIIAKKYFDTYASILSHSAE